MLDRAQWAGKRVLLLQGPIGPYFRRLARDLRRAGAEVRKINFNGGDWAFYPRGEAYRGSLGDWASHLNLLLKTWRPHAVGLFGDRRPIHEGVAAQCQALGIDCYVFEEGYFRPTYITCELGGVNARSGIPRSPGFFRDHGEGGQVTEFGPSAGTYWYMVLWTCLYYLVGTVCRPCFPHYQHHRCYSLSEALLWGRGLGRKWWRKWLERKTQQALTSTWSGRFFLVPLQVHNDAQVMHYSRFGDVETFIHEVAASFAQRAPSSHILVFKHHPMDRAYRNYATLIERLSAAYNLHDRVKYIHDQHVPTLLGHAAGVVTINSTTGLEAIQHGVPTITLGAAFYDFEGMTYQGSLASFWGLPKAALPDRALYRSFRRWVIQHRQINDNFYAGPLRRERQPLRLSRVRDVLARQASVKAGRRDSGSGVSSFTGRLS